MMVASIHGRLGQDPRAIETRSGKPMTVATIAVDLQDRNGESATQWVGVVAFGRLADDLLRHTKGECIAVSGRCQSNTWTNGSGETQTQLQLVADTIVSARAARPNGGRKRRDAENDLYGDAKPDDGDDLPFNDDIPF